MYVFNAKGDLITLRDLTASELTPAPRPSPCRTPQPERPATSNAVANLDPGRAVTTKSALLAKLETSATDYNGTFAEVSTKAKRSGGFVMTAGVSKAIARAARHP